MLVLPLVFMVVVVAIVPPAAVALAGVVAGVGAVDLWNFNWVRAREHAMKRGIYRELGALHLHRRAAAPLHPSVEGPDAGEVVDACRRRGRGGAGTRAPGSSAMIARWVLPARRISQPR